MQLSKILTIFFLLFLSNTTSAFGGLTEEEAAAKARGKFLYKVLRYEEATPLLDAPARAGDVESQFWMGNIQAIKDKHVSEPALYWFSLAAHQGDVASMIIISNVDRKYCEFVSYCTPGIKGSDEWRKDALRISKQKARLGDGAAMYDMYRLTDSLDWLLKSARTGFAKGQFRLGVEYRKGGGFFLTPGRRKQASKRWILAAAELDYVPAIKDILRQGVEAQDRSQRLYWTRRAVHAGDFESTANYAQWLYKPPGFLTDAPDLVKAYGYMLLLDEAQSPRLKESPYYGYVKRYRILSEMTLKQIEEGRAFAEQWKRNNPPLVKYPRW